MIRSRFTSILLVLVLWIPITGFTGTITTAQIITQTSTAALSCMQWTPIGVCFWLLCSTYSCEVKTSIKVGHYNPDLVVSAYNELGANPWGDMRSLLGSIQKSAATGLLGSMVTVPVDSAGNITEGSSQGEDHRNLIFRETDAIGHPLGALIGVVAGGGLLCESQTTSFFPYYQSALDAFVWRQGVPEVFYPASLIPGLREIGSWPLQTWGGVYPRTGWPPRQKSPRQPPSTRSGQGISSPAPISLISISPFRVRHHRIRRSGRRIP